MPKKIFVTFVFPLFIFLLALMTGCLPLLRTVNLTEESSPGHIPGLANITGKVNLPQSTNRILATIRSKITNFSNFKASLFLDERKIAEQNLSSTGEFFFKNITMGKNYKIAIESGHLSLLGISDVYLGEDQTLTITIDFLSTARAIVYENLKNEISDLTISQIPETLVNNLKNYLEYSASLDSFTFDHKNQSFLELASVTEAISLNTDLVSKYLASKPLELKGENF
ncbi:hypothetical protein ACFL35_07665 [Candidatus Riflebacteria bacterium]